MACYADHRLTFECFSFSFSFKWSQWSACTHLLLATWYLQIVGNSCCCCWFIVSSPPQYPLAWLVKNHEPWGSSEAHARRNNKNSLLVTATGCRHFFFFGHPLEREWNDSVPWLCWMLFRCLPIHIRIAQSCVLCSCSLCVTSHVFWWFWFHRINGTRAQQRHTKKGKSFCFLCMCVCVFAKVCTESHSIFLSFSVAVVRLEFLTSSAHSWCHYVRSAKTFCICFWESELLLLRTCRFAVRIPVASLFRSQNIRGKLHHSSEQI